MTVEDVEQRYQLRDQEQGLAGTVTGTSPSVVGVRLAPGPARPSQPLGRSAIRQQTGAAWLSLVRGGRSADAQAIDVGTAIGCATPPRL